MILDLQSQPLLPPDRSVLSELDWGELAQMWNNNQLGQLHDWLNERWSRLIHNSPLGTKDPEAELLQALAFATLALFFTQSQNQDGARLLIDDALLALGKYRPSYMGIKIEPIYGTLQDLRPMLVGLATDAECPMYPFAYAKFEYTRAAP